MGLKAPPGQPYCREGITPAQTEQINYSMCRSIRQQHFFVVFPLLAGTWIADDEKTEKQL